MHRAGTALVVLAAATIAGRGEPATARVEANLAALAVTTSGSELDTISIDVAEGTILSFDVAREQQGIVIDLLGQLWLVPAAGGRADQLTDAVADTAEDQDPSFSPDGRRVVFTGERRGRTGLWLLELDSRRIKPLVQHPDPGSWAGRAAWSPDGSTIAFERSFPEDTVAGRRVRRIALIEWRTRDVRTLSVAGPPPGNQLGPAWSPDGSRIAFVLGGESGGRLWVVPAGGGAATPLTTEQARVMAPAFAPDGRTIAFLAPDSADRLQVWVQDAAAVRSGGTSRPAVRMTAEDEIAATRVRWSADGSALYYSAAGRLWRIGTSGAPTDVPFEARLVITRPRPELPSVRLPEPGQSLPARGFMGLAISPDARAIAAIALAKLWVIPVDGSGPRAVADLPHTARYVAWAPDGTELAWSAGAGDHVDVFATTIATGATRRVTALPGRELYPAWSPDGRHIAFTHDFGNTQLRVIDARAPTVMDTLRTRGLGPARASWLGSNAFTPMWSPGSDALVLISGLSRSGVRGELARLSGEPDSAALPELPLFASWTPGSLTWVRHDRLWRAPFDASGIAGEPQPLGSAPALYASASSDGTVLFVSGDGLRLRFPSGTESGVGWPIRYTPPLAPALLIRNVRIIDGTGRPATPPRDLLVERGRIARIAAPGSIAAASRRVLDASGSFAIPGLMDVHAHGYMPEVLPGFLYFGVTLVRDQGSAMAPIAAFADAVAAGAVPGPRTLYGGFQFYSDWPHDDEEGRGIEPEADAQHVARAVALANAFGAQHIKTRTFRRWDINARMIAEAHRHGLRATGHCALQLPLIAAGMDAKEHAGSCATRGWRGRDDYLQYDDANQLLRAAEVAFVPTISYFAFAARLNERPDLLAADAELAPFLLDSTSFGWMLSMDSTDRAVMQRAARAARRTTSELAAGGVTIGTGTDIWQLPTAVHLELEELVAAGLAPLEAIRAATLGSAHIAGVARDLGTIEIGKLADLVLLDADPVGDIRNTRRIRHVIQNGQLVDRSAIRERFAVGAPLRLP